MLKGKKQREGIIAMKNGKKIIEITKEYGNDMFEDNITCVGYPINVYQESINKTFREYLVNFDYLTRVLENYGFVLANKEEVESMRLPGSSGTFNELYTQMEREIKRNNSVRQEIGDALKMTPEEKKISFANRYFVYKKVRNVDAEAISLQGLDQTASEEALEKQETAQAIATITKTQKSRKPKIKIAPQATQAPTGVEPSEQSLVQPVEAAPTTAPVVPDVPVSQPQETRSSRQPASAKKPKKKLLIKPATETTLEESLSRPQESLPPPPEASTKTAKKPRAKSIKIKTQPESQDKGEGKGPEEQGMMNNIIENVKKVSDLLNPFTSPLGKTDFPEKEVKSAEKQKEETMPEVIDDDMDVIDDAKQNENDDNE
jgi:hypothetical protein